MGSHSITCHPTQVNAPRLTPAMHAGTRFTYTGGMEGWVDLVDLIAPGRESNLRPFDHEWVRRRIAAPPRQQIHHNAIDVREVVDWLLLTVATFYLKKNTGY